MADEETLGVYRAKAEDYARMVAGIGSNRHLDAFIAALPAGAHVLDLGCGTGNASAAMVEAGLTIDAWDGSPEMASVARDQFGLDVQVKTFDMLTAIEVYDGVYANFSLLHAPKADMPANLDRCAQALKPGGILHLGLKTGSGEARDKLGRFYAYYSDAEITGLLEAAGLSVTSRVTGEEAGLDGAVAPWIIMKAKKND